ncbi:hypothetical protein L228DRAFT_250582 [Xylona heveae TC161]|uniref:PXA domain-containing protein n=1 Tax=Xylona heveae (strain CBS 132557 / TC161) TaxID=1328760 RepID=A0A165A9J8_XYLHT|nr:hypothetical protein L228DRAFT_250582 [Xylona heveae TC161]KZF20133.1 hypothetical protein L228DRAFT_250582 [Xylona heveae TC161]
MEVGEQHPGGSDPIADAVSSDGDHQRLNGKLRQLPGVASKDIEQGSTSANEGLTDQALRFFSNASNETLGACLVGLGATTYFVLGRVGLVLIGVVGGVAIHASWEDGSTGASSDEKQSGGMSTRREPGVKIVERLLDWRDRKNAEDEKGELATGVSKNRRDHSEYHYSNLPPATRSALSDLTDAIIRDYVKFWYSPILPAEASFPAACQQTLTGFMLSVSSHLSRKRPADSFLDFLTNASSIIIVFFNELSSAISAPSPIPLPAPKAVLDYLESNPDSNLANLLSQKHQQRKLVMVAEDVLQTFLEPAVYSCLPARVFLREILAGVILESTIQTCSQPEWINGWIVSMLEKGEPEIMNAIDAGVTGTDGKGLETVKRQAETTRLASVKEDSLEESVRRGEGTQPETHSSKAEVAMEAAMREAQRLNEMIAEEDARRHRSRVSEESTSRDGPKPDSANHASHSMTLPSDSGILEPNEAFNGRSSAEAARSFIETANSEKRSTPSAFPGFDTQQSVITEHKDDSAIVESPSSATLSLVNASISLIDDSLCEDGKALRSKPASDYLIQIEPASQKFPGWMIARNYVDFETLHEVMRRISMIAGIPEFGERYRCIPSWKGNTKSDLRLQLEVYLRTALTYRQLAESEGMKRFLNKDQGLDRIAQGNKSGFPGLGWPSPAAFETMGKGMLDVLSSAPKNAADGGKTLLGGVTGVFGGVGGFGQKRQSSGNLSSALNRTGSMSAPSLSRTDSQDSFSGLRRSRDSEDNGWRASGTSSIQREILPHTMPASRTSNDSASGSNYSMVPDTSLRRSISGASEMSRKLELSTAERGTRLPPPPSEISDDYTSPPTSEAQTPSQISKTSLAPSPKSAGAVPDSSEQGRTSGQRASAALAATLPSHLEETPAKSQSQSAPLPINEQETQVAVELIFAVINELYTLSSAWNIRRTLLTAAKTFLLRPGNPNLEAIRALLQESVIEANTSDEGIASHLRSIRENIMPTEEERRKWPPPKSEKEKEDLRRKARKLLVEHGMPQALTSVMGAAASGEALGRVFDCLQIEQIARGLIFGLLLQAVRAIAQ